MCFFTNVFYRLVKFGYYRFFIYVVIVLSATRGLEQDYKNWTSVRNFCIEFHLLNFLIWYKFSSNEFRWVY